MLVTFVLSALTTPGLLSLLTIDGDRRGEEKLDLSH